MDTKAQTFFDNRTAATTGLRSVRSVHKRDVANSIYRFVAQQRLECAESSVVSRQGQVRMGKHEIEVEIFESNQAVGIRQPVSELVPEVFANVGDVLMQSSSALAVILAPIAAFDCRTEFALCSAKFRQMLTQPTRVVDERTIRERQQPEQPHITANRRQTVRFHFDVRHFQHQISVPTSCFALDNHMLDLRLVGQKAVQLDLDCAYILDVQHKAIKAIIVFQPATVAVGVFNALETIFSLETWIARSLACFNAAKECRECLIQLAEGMLQTAGVENQITEAVAPVAEIRPLVDRTLAVARCFVGVLALLQRPVVHLAVLLKQQVQCRPFSLAGIQPVFVNALHLGSPLLRDVSLDCLSADISCGPHIIRTGPQGRQPTPQERKFLSQLMTGCPFELVNYLSNRNRWRKASKQVNVIWHDNQFQYLTVHSFDLLRNQFSKAFAHFTFKHPAAILWAEYEVVVNVVMRVSSLFCIHKRIVHPQFVSDMGLFSDRKEFDAFPTELKHGVP